MVTTIQRQDYPSSAGNNYVYYSDFTDNLDVHPDTGDLFRLTNINAVKRSIRNLVLTDKYERPFNEDVGCNVRSLLFENQTPDTLTVAAQTVQNTIKKFEPRAINVSVSCSSSIYNGAAVVSINIAFTVINIFGQQSLTINIPIVSRVR